MKLEEWILRYLSPILFFSHYVKKDTKGKHRVRIYQIWILMMLEQLRAKAEKNFEGYEEKRREKRLNEP